MEGDRIAVLTLDAALEGIIDYKQARLGDPAWWQKCRLLITALHRKRQGQADEARARYYGSLIGAGLDAKSFKDIQTHLQEAHYDSIGALQPWNGKSFRDRKAEEFKDARQAYIDAFGVDPQDPAFKEWEAQTIAELQAASPETETDDERLTRRLAERDRNQDQKRKRKGDRKPRKAR